MSLDLQTATHWLHEFHAAGDTLDVDTWAKYFTDDATLVMGNHPPVTGRNVYTKAYSHQVSLLNLMHHELLGIDVVENRVYDKTMLTYEVKGDESKEKIKIPSLVIMDLTKDKKIQRMEVFSDPSPLMMKVKAVMAAKAQAAAA